MVQCSCGFRGNLAEFGVFKIGKNSSRLESGNLARTVTGFARGAVRKDLPVWRELKLIASDETQLALVSSERPSRLKGIETCCQYPVRILLLRSERPSRLKGIETNTKPYRLWKSVWLFGKTFPFEGNWNLHCILLYLKRNFFSSERPSRLKGIETYCKQTTYIFMVIFVRKDLPVWRELKLYSVYTINWTLMVRKDLPVWRELKLLICTSSHVKFGRVRKDLPVWRELKLNT